MNKERLAMITVERRKHNRIKTPKISFAAITVKELSMIVNKKVVFGRVYDIDPDGLCVTSDTLLPEGKNIELILRLFKKDVKFNGNIIRANKEHDTTFLAFLFNWKNTPEQSKEFLQKFLETI
jgi:hypothetical protein